MSIWISAAAIAAATAAAPATSTETVETFEYTIKKGDSCAKISTELYGSRKHYEVIHQYNRWLGPKLPHYLEEGQVLVLPKKLPPALPDAEITAAQRTVEARSPQTPDWSRARPGLDLYRGWRVNTQERASAEITFRDYSRIALRQNTLVIIYGSESGKARRQTTEATLDRGSLRTRLDSYTGTKGAAVKVTMPSAVANLDGGTGLLTVDEEGTARVANHGSGKASVRSSKGGATVKVKSKMGSKVVKDKKPTKPKPLPPTPGWNLGSAVTFAAAGDRGTIQGSWSPVAIAKSYRVEVTRQADGSEVVASRTVTDTTLNFEIQQLPPGDYYVSVAAIDDDKFESPPSDRRKLSLISVPLLTPGGAPLSQGDEAAAPQEGAPAKVLRGTRLDVPRGLRCRVDAGEYSRQPVLRDAGDHAVSCIDDNDAEVPGFNVTVVEVQVAAQADAQSAVRGGTTVASFALNAEVPVPRRVWVEAPDGLLVGAPKPSESEAQPGQWTVRVHADPGVSDDASLQVMADAGGVPVQLGQIPLKIEDADPDDETSPTVVSLPPQKPELHMIEAGLMGGVMLPSSNHDLFQERFDVLIDHQTLNRVAPSFGFRLGYYPIRWVGAELEQTLTPTRTRDTDDRATLFSIRGHLLAQMPWRVTPTVHIGGGAMGISAGAALGRDIDRALHFGGGVKIHVTRWAAIRLDARDIITEGFGGGLAHSPEVLLGIAGVIGRRSAHAPKRKTKRSKNNKTKK